MNEISNGTAFLEWKRSGGEVMRLLPPKPI